MVDEIIENLYLKGMTKDFSEPKEFYNAYSELLDDNMNLKVFSKKKGDYCRLLVPAKDVITKVNMQKYSLALKEMSEKDINSFKGRIKIFGQEDFNGSNQNNIYSFIISDRLYHCLTSISVEGDFKSYSFDSFKKISPIEKIMKRHFDVF